jgi:flagellar hook-associated protein 1 FlgK
MSNLFGALNNSYTGLKTASILTEVTSHNVANSKNENYTRQRVNLTSQGGLSFNNHKGVVGQGVQVASIERIFDEFKFTRYKDTSRDFSFASYKQSKLVETSHLFPEINKSGLYKSLQNYFNQWSELSSNPTSSSHKADLFSKAQRLANDTKVVRENLFKIQKNINNEIPTLVQEINSHLDQIAIINKQIMLQEAKSSNTANDLRDQRDALEMALSNIIPIHTSNKGVVSNNSSIPGSVDSRDTVDSGYSLTINGLILVDGSDTNHIVAKNNNNAQGFYSIAYEYPNENNINIEDSINSGKLGAMLELRGKHYNSDDNRFEDGTLQKYIDNIDSFASGLIKSTNSVYASSATSHMESNKLISTNEKMIVRGLDGSIKTGSFDVVVYNTQGNEIAKRSINIESGTTIEDIVNQINLNKDDNNDASSANDIDDYFEASFSNGQFSISKKNNNSSNSIAIFDKGTNFAGALGVSRFFDGNDATNINVTQSISDDTNKISGSRTSADGDNKVALDMKQLQYDKVDFMQVDANEYAKITISGFFTQISTLVASETFVANEDLDTKKTLNRTVKQEFNSLTKVSLDEELNNLMVYQTSYQANAKVITTIDQMLNTLLGIKQP